MTQPESPYTPYPDVNQMLGILIENIQGVLGDQVYAMSLEGSLANGDFDEDSDIDFVVVTEGEIREETFRALREMHDRLQAVDSKWADQLEGSYLSKRGVRKYDPAFALYPNMERGRGEQLKLWHHDEMWDIHRHILLKRGITIVGPEPKELIDPVPVENLRKAMRVILDGWATEFLSNPGLMSTRGYQSYVVLSMCRILYTLAHGDIISKKAAARWASETLEERWQPFIESAWVGRHRSNMPPYEEDVLGTLAMIRYVKEEAEKQKSQPA